MKEIDKNLFSATRSVVQRGTVAILSTFIFGLFLIAGCKKDKPNGIKEPEYPRDILFTEYTLPITCQWTNLNYDNTVIIINNEEELSKYVTCADGNYPKIDFTKNTLLVANLKTDYQILGTSIRYLRQISEIVFELDINISLKIHAIHTELEEAILCEKLMGESIINLEITTTENDITLVGTFWELVGFVDVKTGELKEVEPINCEPCYKLSFPSDSSFFGGTTSNDFWGTYICDYETFHFQITLIHISKVGERTASGYIFNEILRSNKIESFFLSANELNLFYNKNMNYLLFKPFER